MANSRPEIRYVILLLLLRRAFDVESSKDDDFDEDEDESDDLWILSTYAVLSPNKTDYTAHDIISGCSLQDITLNREGLVRNRARADLIRFKIRISKLGRYNEHPIFETSYTFRALMPAMLHGMNFREIAVYAICLTDDNIHYKIQIPMEGMVSAKASVDDFSVVYEGQEIECSEGNSQGDGSLWLYHSGLTQLSSGNILKIVKPEKRDLTTPETSYACCSIGSGWHRKIYTFHIGTYYTQLVSPTKDMYSPGEVITCHLYISTLADVNKATEALTHVGTRIETRLQDHTVKIFERVSASTVILPDYPQPVKSYVIQCLLNGEPKTDATEFKAALPFATYLKPYKSIYQPGDQIKCSNDAIYGTRRTQIIVIVVPRSRKPTPILTFEALTSSYIRKVKSEEFVNLERKFLQGDANLIALCEILEGDSIHYSTPIQINIRTSIPLEVVVIHPKGIPIDGITYLIPGAILRCKGKYPMGISWGLAQGNPEKCRMQTYQEFLIVPQVKVNCIMVYTCSAYTNITRTEVITLRYIFEIIAKYECKIAGTQVFVLPNQRVGCSATGHSDIMNEPVYISLEANLWFRVKMQAPRNMGTSVVPSTQIVGKYLVDCQEKRGHFSELKSLIVSNAEMIYILYEPDKGNDLYPGDSMKCFTSVQDIGEIQLDELVGLLHIEIISDSVSVVLVNRTRRFIVPEWVHVTNQKIHISKVEMKVSCDLRGKLEEPWIAKVVSCDDHIQYIDIEPSYTETVSIGVWFHCTTDARCRNNFNYEITVSSASMEHVDGRHRFSALNKPIKITYEMLGVKKIKCTARGEGMTILRKIREVIIESQPAGMTITRQSAMGFELLGDVELVNMNESLHCNSRGYPIPRIEWKRITSPEKYKDHKLITHGNQIIITTFDPSGYYLYQCSAVNSLGKIFYTHRFYVRNVYHASHEGQTKFMYWILLTLLFFLTLFLLGYFTINAEFLRTHPLALRDFIHF